jgi:signal transduction histidine kinase
MRATKKVLFVEDNSGDIRLLREMFGEDRFLSFEMASVGSMAEAEKHLAANAPDIVLLDLGLPDAQGMAAIRRARLAAPGVPLVVLTGMDDEGLAAQSLQEGAQDYLIKGEIETRGLLRALRHAGERKHLEQLKAEFVSTISHELRTPLTSIAASLGLLMGKAAGPLSGPAARLLQIAHTNSERLVRLVNDILDIEKLESGRLAFEFERVEVRSLVEDAVEAIGSLAEGYGVRIRIDAASVVNEARADADRLSQVITNLLSNAVKFSPPDSEVVVAVETDVDVVRISVRDHGSGIPVEFRARVFERFAQADATDARCRGGTGLGLSIVKQIVDRLGGEVCFGGAPGGGTVFRVEVPIWIDLVSEELVQTAPAGSSKPSCEYLTPASRLALSPAD